jgi:hypothetical protein
MSTTQSAWLITSRWCSTTTTVEPPSTRRSSRPTRVSTSPTWRPVVPTRRAQLHRELQALALAAAAAAAGESVEGLPRKR